MIIKPNYYFIKSMSLADFISLKVSHKYYQPLLTVSEVCGAALLVEDLYLNKKKT